MGEQEEVRLVEARAQFDAKWRDVEAAASGLVAGVTAWWPDWIMGVAQSQITMNAEHAKKAGAGEVKAFRSFAEGLASQGESVTKRYVNQVDVLAHLQGRDEVGKSTWWSPETGRLLQGALRTAAGPMGRELINRQLIPNSPSSYWQNSNGQLRYGGTVELGDGLNRLVRDYDKAVKDARTLRVKADEAKKARDKADALGLWNGK